MDPFYLSLLLYVAAIVLAIVDVFVPSGGLLLILSAVTATACVLFGFRAGSTLGMAMLTVVIASIPVFIILAIHLWPKTLIGKQIILGLPTRKDASHPIQTLGENLTGVVVQAEHALMPSGQIRVRGKRYNATTGGEIIEAGQNVEVIGVKERNLIVRSTTAKCTPEPTATQESPAGMEPSPEPNPLDQPADEIGIDSLE